MSAPPTTSSRPPSPLQSYHTNHKLIHHPTLTKADAKINKSNNPDGQNWLWLSLLLLFLYRHTTTCPTTTIIAPLRQPLQKLPKQKRPPNTCKQQKIKLSFKKITFKNSQVGLAMYSLKECGAKLIFFIIFPQYVTNIPHYKLRPLQLSLYKKKINTQLYCIHCQTFP